MLKKYYKILEVDISATDEEIKIGYLNKVKQFPPETHPEEFAKIYDAFDILSNKYDFIEKTLMGEPNIESNHFYKVIGKNKIKKKLKSSDLLKVIMGN